jgi:malonate-semialdehyde dehydrogenase (acetylating)/methylmalonate-semialdehyde dehydrogenase
VRAACGAKNHLIIMPDADLDQAALAVQTSAFGCAGERCMAGSLALPVGSIADRIVDRLCDLARGMRVGPTDGGAEVDMGPVISRDHWNRLDGYLETSRTEGAEILVDGRGAKTGDGFLIGPSVLDRVDPGMRVAREEIFGPILSVVRVRDLDEALAVGRNCPYGNGASIFTRSGWAAREFKHRFNAGMIGINVGVPAPMAWFPFTGWNQSFFGDLHIQGVEGMQFYTRQKMTMTSWFAPTSDSQDD